MSIYDYSFERLTGGEEESLSEYKNQVLLIVNTASKCGFTPQYEGLEHLYEKYKDKGFAVLGFPSDSFMKQEFDESEKIAAFCKANYGVTFPLFKKSKMKGKEMNRHGHAIGYYGSRTKPEDLEEKIEELLQA